MIHFSLKAFFLNISLFIAILLSSCLGSSFFGISLNKVCLIPFMIYLIFDIKSYAIERKTIPLLLFFIIALCSSIYALTASYSSEIIGYKNSVILYFVQIIIFYIPLIFLIQNSKSKELIYVKFISIIKLVCKIHAIWGVFQFLIFTVFKYNINNSIAFLYGGSTPYALINLGSLGVFLRPSGLNFDPAYFGIILVIGVIFESKKIWKLFYLICAFLAMSRSSILVICLLFIFPYIIGRRKIKLSKSNIAIFLGCCLVIVLLFSFPATRNQINALLSRFNFKTEINSQDQGTMRHLLYIPKSILVLFTQYNPLQVIIGFGPRQSGTIIAHSGVMNDYLLDSMFSTSWIIECDVADLLLGYGLIGFVLYYVSLINIARYNKKYGIYLAVSIFVYGIMYDISASTFVLLIIIIMSCSSLNQRG